MPRVKSEKVGVRVWGTGCGTGRCKAAKGYESRGGDTRRQWERWGGEDVGRWMHCATRVRGWDGNRAHTEASRLVQVLGRVVGARLGVERFESDGSIAVTYRAAVTGGYAGAQDHDGATRLGMCRPGENEEREDGREGHRVHGGMHRFGRKMGCFCDARSFATQYTSIMIYANVPCVIKGVMMFPFFLVCGIVGLITCAFRLSPTYSCHSSGFSSSRTALLVQPIAHRIAHHTQEA